MRAVSSKIGPLEPRCKIISLSGAREVTIDAIQGRLIFIHLGGAALFAIQRRRRYIKIVCPKDPEFYTPLALKYKKGSAQGPR